MCDVFANPLGCGIEAWTNSQIEGFVKALLQGCNDMFSGFYTSWVTAGMDGIIGGGLGEWFTSISTPIQVFLLTIGWMVAGVRTALAARGEPAGEAAKKFLRVMFITTCGTFFLGLLLSGCNELARWILQVAMGTDGTTGLIAELETFGSNLALALLVGFLLAIVVAIQWVIMVIRSVALTVLTPYWPIAASAAMFEQHEGAYQKTTGWLLAFATYSPVAATLYGMSIVLRRGSNGLMGVMLGLALFVLAIAALPALMRLVVPLSSAIGRMSAAGMAWQGVRAATTAAVAGGATVATMGAAGAAAGGAAATGGGTAGVAAATGGAAEGAAGVATPTGSATAAEAASSSSGAANTEMSIPATAQYQELAPVGAAGSSGASGSVGGAGAPGGTGLSGGAGSSGGEGFAGGNGASGFAGGTGSSGVAGSSGEPGGASVPGGTGAPGSHGAPGSDGESGSSGAAGTAGGAGTPGTYSLPNGAQPAPSTGGEPQPSTGTASGSGRSATDALRDLSQAMPYGGPSIGEAFDE